MEFEVKVIISIFLLEKDIEGQTGKATCLSLAKKRKKEKKKKKSQIEISPGRLHIVHLHVLRDIVHACH